jgi:hypothetical protein
MIDNSENVSSELKRNSAAMGMVFFGLKYGKDVADLDRYVESGILVCDTIIKGQAVPQSGLPRYEDRAVRDAFVKVASRVKRTPDKERQIVNKAVSARRTLLQLRERESVTDKELDLSAEFFRKICSAM